MMFQREGLAAVITLKVLLISVCLEVFPECGALNEGLTADLTLKILLIFLDEAVLLEDRFPTEGLAAGVTHIGLPVQTRVCGHFRVA